MSSYKNHKQGDYPHIKLLVQTIQEWDGQNSLADWKHEPGAEIGSTYKRLLEHSFKVKLNLRIAQQQNKLVLTLDLLS